MIFEWDPGKGQRNLRKHGVSFEEAATVFLDPMAMTYPDPDHSNEEDREITIGYSKKERLLFVSHVRKKDRIRIISARQVTRRERKQHEEGIEEEG
ncbi:MAG: BrnT family toxin [Candidatus Binatia bacterium]